LATPQYLSVVILFCSLTTSLLYHKADDLSTPFLQFFRFFVFSQKRLDFFFQIWYNAIAEDDSVIAACSVKSSRLMLYG